ncbi:MAG: hypothetical protein ACYTAO_23125, partial [Planctomycetota bacterium]
LFKQLEELTSRELLLSTKTSGLRRLEEMRSWWSRYTELLSYDQKRRIIEATVDQVIIRPDETKPSDDWTPKQRILWEEYEKLENEPRFLFEIKGNIPIVPENRLPEVGANLLAILACWM